ncbi:MAG: protein kinase [Acidobacteria bacterium]|nr:protein kinase [Acidobacteriota bacterium]NIM61242.1 protein kinase [Acidobacteriota bacterium]NIO58047.1 protein kinase [Acidobacteriota bacterium]NIQ29058.1 protein kinase [Acidobacteriota bacterium]NIQ83586.1 protein kinase [Acidobacteriota bacterium]
MDGATLRPGQDVLHYRIGDKIGEGGMGEVWRATDTELGREVAIKVLPAILANDGERLARFQREARLLASLNHPHIATIHGLHEGETDGKSFRFLVMELVEGEDLTEVVEGRPAVERAIEIAIQIAEALEAAHDNGIVHRDLKPANVKMTATREVKVLDFGLAKAVGVETESGGAPGPTMSPTITSAGTVAGTILGTAAYMSPEQARGRSVDRRADMWAFGCLLYELLSGRRAFCGDTISDTLAAVLKEQPDWAALPAETPSGVRRLLRRCLEKDARKRWGDAGDARIELEESLATPEDEDVSTVAVAAPRSTASPVSRFAPWLVAAASLVVAVAAWFGGGSTDESPRELLRLTIPLGDGLRVEDDQMGNVAISQDAAAVVFSGIDANGQSALYLRALDSEEIVKLEGTDNAENPFFSPDGNWVAFFSSNRILKVPVAGGPPVEVCANVGSARGATWGPDDRMIFPRHFDSSLWQVPGSGGTAEPLTQLDEERRERTHRWPFAVPDRPIVLFTVATKDSPEYYEDALIDAFDLDTGERKTVFEGASFAVYAQSGHLIFGRGGSLWAVPFDIDRLETTGTPAPVQSNVMGLRNSGVVFASLATNGLLAFVEGEAESLDRVVLRRGFDGGSEPIGGIQPGAVLNVSISPDGKKIALNMSGMSTYDVWVYDLDRENRTRLTFEGDNQAPIWGPEGRFVYYSSERDGRTRAFRKQADGSGDEELMWEVDGVSVGVQDVAPDGKTLLLTYYGENKADLYTLDLTDPAAEPRPLLDGPFEEDLARFSPDGRWLAYTTDEPGSFEVYVRPASGSGGQWQISSEGGVLPRWSHDGKQMFYRIGRRMFVVDVEAGEGTTAFRSSNPRLVFDDLERARLTSGYDILPDGESIVVPQPNQKDAPLDSITVLVNWLDEVERLVPAGR